MNNSEIIKFLTSKATNAGFVDKLKIKYRPIICPFNDLIDFAKAKRSVFDIGCGSGQFCALIAKYTNVEKIMGIEINERLVKNANEVNEEFRTNKNIKFEVFDGKVIPDEIKDYDLVYMIDVFHHIPPDQQISFMQQLQQKMKAGAVLIFKDIDAGSPLVLCNKMHDMVFAGEIGKEISVTKAKNMLSKTGFKINNCFKKTVFVYAHYFVICEKQ
ncbi:MAG TPA: class I SAM-dependent methyltransferase [Bacteroidia bacterium]|jgi:SAM-dependent methyltransferase|nr:class I SAM-dependent methyltransferase [Bacteroidia bacterium]